MSLHHVKSNIWEVIKTGNYKYVEQHLTSKNIKETDIYGNTLLLIACDYGYKDIVKLLITSNLNINITHKNKFNECAFTIAIKHHINIALLILKTYISNNIFTYKTTEFICLTVLTELCNKNLISIIEEYYIKNNINLDYEDINGSTIFIKACINNNINMVKYLLTKNVNINHSNRYGFNGLFYAYKNNSNKMIEILNLHLTLDNNMCYILNKINLHLNLFYYKSEINMWKIFTNILSWEQVDIFKKIFAINSLSSEYLDYMYNNIHHSKLFLTQLSGTMDDTKKMDNRRKTLLSYLFIING